MKYLSFDVLCVPKIVLLAEIINLSHFEAKFDLNLSHENSS